MRRLFDRRGVVQARLRSENYPGLTVPLVGPADDHHGEVAPIVHAVVVDGRLEELLVLLQPLGKVDGLWDHLLTDGEGASERQRGSGRPRLTEQREWRDWMRTYLK